MNAEPSVVASAAPMPCASSAFEPGVLMDAAGASREQAAAGADAMADQATTARIRSGIVADKRLSLYAHNVKIITVNGVVILRGPVKSEEERRRVTSRAAAIVTTERVTDELTIRTR